jgi:hypothetical protein
MANGSALPVEWFRKERTAYGSASKLDTRRQREFKLRRSAMFVEFIEQTLQAP